MSIPDEIHGAWKRQSVVVEDGPRFETQHVVWLQAGPCYADLRVPFHPAGDIRCFAGRRWPDRLERHNAPGPPLPCLVHLAHAAPADVRYDFVAGESGPCGCRRQFRQGVEPGARSRQVGRGRRRPQEQLGQEPGIPSPAALEHFEFLQAPVA